MSNTDPTVPCLVCYKAYDYDKYEHRPHCGWETTNYLTGESDEDLEHLAQTHLRPHREEYSIKNKLNIEYFSWKGYPVALEKANKNRFKFEDFDLNHKIEPMCCDWYEDNELFNQRLSAKPVPMGIARWITAQYSPKTGEFPVVIQWNDYITDLKQDDKESQLYSATVPKTEAKAVFESTPFPNVFLNLHYDELKQIHATQGWLVANQQIYQLNQQDYINLLTFKTDKQKNLSYDFENQKSKKTSVKTGLIKNIREIKTINGHSSYVQSVVYSPCGQFLASGSSDNNIKIWNTTTGDCLKTFSHTSTVSSVKFSSCGKFLISGSNDRSVKIWNIDAGTCFHELKEHSSYVYGVAYSPNDELIASGSNDKSIKVWNTTTGKCLNTLTGHSEYVWCLVYSPCGQFLIPGSEDKTIKIWGTSTGKNIKTLSEHSNWISSLMYSPCGQFMISSSGDKSIKIWDVNTWACVKTITGHSNTVQSVVYSPCGKYLASGSEDKTIKIWNVNTGECLNTLTGHSSYVYSVAYSPNGEFIVSGSWDNTIKIWQIDFTDE